MARILSFYLRICCIFHVVSLVIFLKGCFKIDNASLLFRPSRADRSDNNNSETFTGLNYEPVGSVVLVIIDSLRAEFMASKSEAMPFLMGKISAGEALSYYAKVQWPTVTMPRIKALMSGILPDFVDIVRNFASSEYAEDNVLRSLTASNRTAVFFGDETWMKLFPHSFSRSDPVASFLLSDYTEVDDNVTRHLAEELPRRDWHVMVLHYLGLDHIGHTYRVDSPLIAMKLREMDRIIARIYTTLSEAGRDFAVLVLGDHGMNSAGSHGGSSDLESETPVVVLSSRHKKQRSGVHFARVEQVDVTPTLALLLKLPLPIRSVGVLLPGVTEMMFNGAGPRCQAHVVNSCQLHRLCVANPKACTKDLASQLGRYCALPFKYSNRSSFCEAFADDMTRTTVDARSRLLQSRDYGLSEMVFGLILSLCVVCQLLRLLPHRIPSPLRPGPCFRPPLLAVGCLLLIVSQASSSFVEQEPQLWFFFLASAVLCAVFRGRTTTVDPGFASLALTTAAVLLLNRCLALFSLLATQLQAFDAQPKSPSMLLMASMGGTVSCCLYTVIDSKEETNRLFVTASFAAIVLCKLYQAGMPLLPEYVLKLLLPRIVAVVAFGLLFLPRLSNCGFASRLATSSLLVVFLLTRPELSIVLVLTVMEEHLLSGLGDRLQLHIHERIVFYHLLAGTSYFALGSTNSLGTIDFSAAYTGLATYQPIAIVLNVTGSIYGCSFWTWVMLLKRTPKPAEQMHCLFWLFLLRSLSMMSCLLVVSLLRYHAFIWSVFIPKLLYECCSTALVSLMVFLATFMLAHQDDSQPGVSSKLND